MTIRTSGSPMIAISRACCTGLACLGAALTVGATPLVACDPVWLPIARPAGRSSFVALALADTVLDTARRVAAGSPFEARLDPVVGRSRGGQRVRLLRSPRPGTEREAVVVPWAYGPDCRPIAWSGPLPWIPAGTRGVVTGWLRSRDRWLDGVPTYDVEMAWREPLWAQADPRWTHPGGGELLTPDEFLELYAALPEETQLERSPAQVARRAREWARRHSALAKRPPAAAMLDNLQRAAAAQTDPQPGN
jgi:hypothetical protein